MKAKIKGMESYEFEKRKFPHPRSPEALKNLAQYRGISSGNEYSEAFRYKMYQLIIINQREILH